jgi:oxygen-independent coproporphyrinogen-3 oxidase
VEFDLTNILSLGVQHVSTYGLKIEEGSYFYEHIPDCLPDEDSQADMYLNINRICEAKGFHRYEISNFSLRNYESNHNLVYWNNEEYYGFGLASHGYKNGIRYSKTSNLKEYLLNPIVAEQEHLLTTQEQLEEAIFLGFRKEAGINVSEINHAYSIDFETKYSSILDKYCPKYLTKTQTGYKLTINGVLLSNNILAEFLD